MASSRSGNTPIRYSFLGREISTFWICLANKLKYRLIQANKYREPRLCFVKKSSSAAHDLSCLYIKLKWLIIIEIRICQDLKSRPAVRKVFFSFYFVNSIILWSLNNRYNERLTCIALYRNQHVCKRTIHLTMIYFSVHVYVWLLSVDVRDCKSLLSN